MNKEEAVEFLALKYPDAKIIDQGDEVVAEVSPGLAVAAILKSKSHFHLHTDETYRVILGSLAVISAGKVETLHDNCREDMWIDRRTVHSAVGIGGWAVVEVKSRPPWNPEDHFLV